MKSRNTKLNKEYLSLLRQADECNSRKDAIHLINKADVIRREMVSSGGSQ